MHADGWVSGSNTNHRLLLLSGGQSSGQKKRAFVVDDEEAEEQAAADEGFDAEEPGDEEEAGDEEEEADEEQSDGAPPVRGYMRSNPLYPFRRNGIVLPKVSRLRSPVSGLRNFDPKDLPVHGSFPFDLVTGARLSHWGYDPRREPGRKELCAESGPSFGLDRANEQKRPCKFVGLEDKIRTVAKTGLHALSRSLKMLWQLRGGCMEGMIWY